MKWRLRRQNNISPLIRADSLKILKTNFDNDITMQKLSILLTK